MTFPKPPEITDHIGCLDDAAVAIDGSVSVHVQRELVRNANAFAARGMEMFRWMSSTQTNADGAQKAGALGFGWPFWHKCIPTPNEGWPVPKPSGITRMRAAIRLDGTGGRRFEFQIGTKARPFTTNPSTSDIISMSCSGGSERFTKEDFVVDIGSDELLDFYVRGEVNPRSGGDGLLNTATYGGKNTGTVTSHFPGVFFDRTTAWNVSGARPSVGGHYVVFSATNDGRILHGPAAIVDEWRDPVTAANDGTGLIYAPAWEGVLPAISTGITYTIYQLPAYRLISVVCAGVDRSS